MTPNDIDEAAPDLAQLLVLEAGRILEDLTTELAVTLPPSPAARYKHLTHILQALEQTHALLAAACSLQGSATKPIERG